jgi:hypothetical protein
VGKHLLDETAEFRMPRLGRHANPETGEFEITQRLDPGAPVPSARPLPGEDASTR